MHFLCRAHLSVEDKMSHGCVERLAQWCHEIAAQTGGRKAFSKECPWPIDGPPVVAAEGAGSWTVPTCQPLRVRFPVLSVSVSVQVGSLLSGDSAVPALSPEVG